jgi:hypothetical protein
VTGFGGARLTKPSTFCVRERFLAQRVLADQASAIENRLYLVKPARGHRIASLLRHLARQHDNESEPVLDISHLDFAYQLPIKIVISDRQRRQRLEHADLDVACGHSGKEDGRGILGRHAGQWAEAWASQTREPAANNDEFEQPRLPASNGSATGPSGQRSTILDLSCAVTGRRPRSSRARYACDTLSRSAAWCCVSPAAERAGIPPVQSKRSTSWSKIAVDIENQMRLVRNIGTYRAGAARGHDRPVRDNRPVERV